jgi:hypothetical protein
LGKEICDLRRGGMDFSPSALALRSPAGLSICFSRSGSVCVCVSVFEFASESQARKSFFTIAIFRLGANLVLFPSLHLGLDSLTSVSAR